MGHEISIIRPDREPLVLAVDDSSYRRREIMGEDELVLNFSLAVYEEIPAGSTVTFEGDTYTLFQSCRVYKRGSRNFEYQATFSADYAYLRKYMFYNWVDKRLSFDLTARPWEHIQMIVDNLNDRLQSGDMPWRLGEGCIESAEKLISYSCNNCMEALQAVADTFETEWEVKGRTIFLRKVEYNADSPLELSYGRGNGLRAGIQRTAYNDETPAARVYIQGGERNIFLSEYGSRELKFPKSAGIGYDGEKFEGEDGYDSTKGVRYVTDDLGQSVAKEGGPVNGGDDVALDLTHIYPSHACEVESVEYLYRSETYGSIDELVAAYPELADENAKGWDNVQVDVIVKEDAYLPDYSAGGLQVPGETRQVVFQSGNLASREFDINDYNHEERRFKLVSEWVDGFRMPAGPVYHPAAGNTFIVVGVSLPSEYVREAEDKALREAVKYLYEHETQKVTINAEIDPIQAARMWDSWGPKIILGGFVRLTDDDLLAEVSDIRIKAVKQYVNTPTKPVVELSNSTASVSFGTTIRKLESQETHTDELHKDSIRFSERRWRDAKSTIKMLVEALTNFSEGINPVTVETMAMLVGDEKLQFVFTESLTSDNTTDLVFSYDDSTGSIVLQESYLKHMTLDINSVAPVHAADEYKRWYVDGHTEILEADKAYYLYVRASKELQEGAFVLSPDALNEDDTHYYFLVGILNSSYNGERSYARMHGFTEVLPGQITTDEIKSSDGKTWLDLLYGILHLNDNAGVSGSIDADKGDKSIAAWYGGAMEDMELDKDSSNPANTLFRHDGSGYLARGNIKFNEKGEVELSPNIKISGTGNETLDSILTMLAVLNDMFYFADENTIGTKYNFFSEQENSAGGKGESIGTEGGVGGSVEVDLEMSDTSENAVANKVIKKYVDAADKALEDRIESLEGNGVGGGSANPDEEDITTNEKGKLQFKNRPADDGMGYVILRKGKALSEQIVNADTIYEVRYDFAFDTDFSMPENCTLRFNGGSLSGAYTLTLNATYIEADDEQVFGDDLSVVGTPANNEGLAEWFGAKGLFGEGKYVGGNVVSLVDGTDALPDSAVAINKSLSIFGITRLGAGKTYRTATTISVPFQKTLDIPKNTIVVPFMSGEGLVIKTVNKSTSEYDDDIVLTEKPLTMLENQFIATDNMAVAITMAARSVLSGGGTIFLGKSDFTIGILIPGYAYDYNDMAWSHRIDTRIIGGPKASCWSPDSRDIIGDVAPTAEVGYDGQYYYNKSNNTYYVKSSGAWSVKSSNYGERNRFNTSIRFYIPSGKRLINPIIDVWDMYGYRGIELITEGDGWFNESIIKGTVSNKHGSFISIFTGGGGASIHHWDDITMQVGKDIGHDARMFFSSKCQHVDLGMVWDLAWFRPPRVVTAFELCRNTADVTLPFVDEISFVKDDGSWNKYIHHPKMTDEQSIVPIMYENALKYMSPTFRGQMVSAKSESIFEVLTRPYTLAELREKEYVAGGIPPKCIFDGDNGSYYRAIDVDNNIYGCVMRLNNRNPNSQIKTRHFQAWLEVDYRPNVYKGDNGCYMSLSSTEEPIQTIGLDHFYESSATWNNDMTLKKFFRIRGGARSHVTTLYIHATADAPAGTTVDIVGVKLWMDSNNVEINRNILGGIEKNRPDAMPKGALFFNEDTGHAEVNKGTSDTPLWEDVAADKMKQLKLIAHSSSDAVAKVVAGEYHRWESATSVFVIPTDFNNALAYVQFTASSAGCDLSFPRDTAVNAYEIVAGKTYMVTVLGKTAEVHEMSVLGYPDEAVRFEDPYTEYLCVKMYGADGYVTEAQLANVTSLSGFSGTDIESFDELNLFTGLTSIPANAFQNCKNLRYISFGSKVESIGEHVFRWAYTTGAADGVQRLRVYAAEPPALGSTQQFFPAVIEVPAICLEAYKTAPVWSNYADRMRPIDGYVPPVKDEAVIYDTLTLADDAEILLDDIMFADNEIELDCTLGASGTTMMHGIASDGTAYYLYRSKNGSYKGASNGATSDTQFFLSGLAHVVAWKADGVYMDGTLKVTQARTAQEWQIRLRGGNNIVRYLDVRAADGTLIHSLRPATYSGVAGLWDSVTERLYGQTSATGTITVA